MSPAADVVVTGLGAVTPLGGDVATTWQAVLEGRSGVSELKEEWAAKLPVRIAAQAATDPADHLSRTRLKRLDRCEAFALLAAREAWADAGLADTGVPGERLAVSIGSGFGGVHTLITQNRVLEQRGPRRVSLFSLIMSMPNGAAANVGIEFGARAGVHAVNSACATGAESVSLGLDIIRSGRADVVVAGGTEAGISPNLIAGFTVLRAMSTRNHDPVGACRPWDRNRDGFVLGEGAGILILERAEHAQARGARIHARLAGAGISSDGFDMVEPDPEGRGGAAAIRLALADSGIAAADIAHVNAHATGTPVGDIAELVAIRASVGSRPVLTATKSMTGHLIGAAGAVESIFTVLAVRDGVIPPTLNLHNPDDLLGFDVAVGEPRRLEVCAAMSNSFGFGGHNVALVFAR
jgi:3-oxoacyl-[acyl-carrier-protein] synthase II